MRFLENIALRRARVEQYNELCGSLINLRMKLVGLQAKTIDAQNAFEKAGISNDHAEKVVWAATGIAEKVARINELWDLSFVVPRRFLPSQEGYAIRDLKRFEALKGEREKVKDFFGNTLAIEVNDGLQVLVDYIALFREAAIRSHVHRRLFLTHNNKIASSIKGVRSELTSFASSRLLTSNIDPGHRFDALREFVKTGKVKKFAFKEQPSDSL